MNSTKPTNNHRRERVHKHLTEHEIDQLLAAAKDETVTRNSIRNYCLLLLMFRHGLRVGEAIRLKVSDVDFQEGKEGTITIRRLKHGVSGIHPLFRGEAKALKAWLAIRAGIDSDVLFVSEQGKPFTRAAINLLLDRIASAASLKNVNPHALRHAAGYHAVNTGTDIRVIQRYLGHKSIASTVIYTEVDHTQFNKLF